MKLFLDTVIIPVYEFVIYVSEIVKKILDSEFLLSGSRALPCRIEISLAHSLIAFDSYRLVLIMFCPLLFILHRGNSHFLK